MIKQTYLFRNRSDVTVKFTPTPGMTEMANSDQCFTVVEERHVFLSCNFNFHAINKNIITIKFFFTKNDL